MRAFHFRKIVFQGKSMKIRLIGAFVITSLIPILLVNIVYYYNTSKLVRQNVESMTAANLEQTRVSLDVWLAVPLVVDGKVGYHAFGNKKLPAVITD